MTKNWIREKKYKCSDEYMTVSVYAVTEQEHRNRGKKRRESSRSQKERNKHASMRRYQRKVLANFDREGFFLTGTYEEEYLPEGFAACRKDVENYKRRAGRSDPDDAVGGAQGGKRPTAHARLCPVPRPEPGPAERVARDAGGLMAAAGAGHERI